MRPLRIAALLLLGFAVGGGSAEVAVQTHRAVSRSRADRETGAAGQLVSIEVHGDDGAVIARPRLIAPPGRTAQLVLRDPADPSLVRLKLCVEAVAEPSGDVSLEYRLTLPERDLSRTGKVSIAPGVEQAVELGNGELTAVFLTLPVPSAAFDAYLESQVAQRFLPDTI